MDDRSYWAEFAKRTHVDPVDGRVFQYNEKRERVYLNIEEEKKKEVCEVCGEDNHITTTHNLYETTKKRLAEANKKVDLPPKEPSSFTTSAEWGF